MSAINGSTIVKITAIISLTIICVVAVFHGIDSVLIGTIASIIGGVAGYEIGRYKREKEESGGGQ
jgi:membrane protein YqaA with SNARE-associated domain